LISYEEFVFSVMRSVDLADSSELEEPFIFADVNGMTYNLSSNLTHM